MLYAVVSMNRQSNGLFANATNVKSTGDENYFAVASPEFQPDGHGRRENLQNDKTRLQAFASAISRVTGERIGKLTSSLARVAFYPCRDGSGDGWLWYVNRGDAGKFFIGRHRVETLPAQAAMVAGQQEQETPTEGNRMQKSREQMRDAMKQFFDAKNRAQGVGASDAKAPKTISAKEAMSHLFAAKKGVVEERARDS